MSPNSAIYPIAPGEVLANKYRIERLLGVGGMGMVVAAHHIELDERVAIKFLLPESLGNAESVQRFAREARSAVKIKSEHVVRTMDVDRLENGAPYIVMEYLEGMDLETRLRVQGPLAIDHAVAVGLQICEALAAAHAIGIVHRDLKPANLFATIGPDGRECVKVLDFGISKIRNPAIESGKLAVTRDAALIGSPMYMSPEQIASARDVDHRCDIWALGVTLHELLTGNAPFFATSMSTLIEKVASQEPPNIRETRPDAPQKLAAIILKCMAKDREQRYPNVAELALALVEFAPAGFGHCVDRAVRVLAAAGFSAGALQLPPSTDPHAAANTNTEVPVSSTRNPTGSPSLPRSTLWIGAGSVILLVISGLFWRSTRAADQTLLSSATVPTLAVGASTIATAQDSAALASSTTSIPAIAPLDSVSVVPSNAAIPSSAPNQGSASVPQATQKARRTQKPGPRTNSGLPYDGNISRK